MNLLSYNDIFELADMFMAADDDDDMVDAVGQYRIGRCGFNAFKEKWL